MPRSAAARSKSSSHECRVGDAPMNIDVTALRGLVREKDVSFDTVVEAIESALLAAYMHTEGSAERARAELDRKSGEARIWAQEYDEADTLVREWDDTPDGFGRIAARSGEHAS